MIMEMENGHKNHGVNILDSNIIPAVSLTVGKLGKAMN